MQLIKKGAEADIFETTEGILKKRVAKNYRVHELDIHIRKTRTRAEANILRKVKSFGISAPDVISVNEKEFSIVIEKINGTLVKNIISKENCNTIAMQLAEQASKLHSIGIVHGDLTTSNMILDKTGKLFLVDFGLAKYSGKAEDKAVDLHLLEETLQSTHPEIAEAMFPMFLKEYQKHFTESKPVMERLNKLRGRGRYKK